MSLRGFSRWFGSSGSSRAQRTTSARLHTEQLEGREVPAVSLLDIANDTFSNQKPLFVPVTNTATPNGRTVVTAQSDNSDIRVDILPVSKTLQLEVSGKDVNGANFSGTITLALFDQSAPLGVQRIIDLTNQGFYDGKTFFRIADDFVIQGGSATNNGSGGNPPGFPTPVIDEFNTDYTFQSKGILAFANAGDDGNGSQYFITDIDTPLSSRPEHLNFNHSILGQLTSGFDVFEKIIRGQVNLNSLGQKTDQATNPAIVTKATIIEDTKNAVLRIQAFNNTTSSANISIQAIDGDNVRQDKSFTVTATADAENERPFLGNIPDVTVTKGGTTSIILPTSNLDKGVLTYQIGSTGDINTPPSNVSTSVNSQTGELTITAPADFTGTVRVLAGVRGATTDFDTQAFNVNVIDAGPAKVSLSPSRTAVGTDRSILLTALLSGNGTESGTVAFFDGSTKIGTANVVDSRAGVITSFGVAGTRNLRAEFTPRAGGSTSNSDSVSVGVTPGAAPVTITAQPVAPGNAPVVNVVDGTGSTRFTLNVFDNSFTGGVRVAVADVTNDGQNDVIAVAGNGGAPIINIYDGETGTLFRSVMIFEDTFRGGLTLDVKDALGKGYSQILVGAGFTGGPRVTLYDAVSDKVVLNYFAYDEAFRGGVSVSLSDLRGGLQFSILTTPGQGGGPEVKVFRARREDGFPVPTQEGNSFLAGSADDRTGRRVRGGALGEDGTRDIEVLPNDENASTFDTFDPFDQGIFPRN